MAEFLGETSKSENYSNQQGEQNILLSSHPGSRGKLHADDGVVNIELEDAANVAATVSKVVLDDDEIDTMISRPVICRPVESEVYFSFIVN